MNLITYNHIVRFDKLKESQSLINKNILIKDQIGSVNVYQRCLHLYINIADHLMQQDEHA